MHPKGDKKWLPKELFYTGLEDAAGDSCVNTRDVKTVYYLR